MACAINNEIESLDLFRESRGGQGKVGCRGFKFAPGRVVLGKNRLNKRLFVAYFVLVGDVPDQVDGFHYVVVVSLDEASAGFGHQQRGQRAYRA
jgi:hypothetical protein